MVINPNRYVGRNSFSYGFKRRDLLYNRHDFHHLLIVSRVGLICDQMSSQPPSTSHFEVEKKLEIDPAKVGFRGKSKKVEDDQNIYLIPINIPQFYSSLFAVTHDSYQDFSVIFAKSNLVKEEYEVQLVVVFNPTTLLHFLSFVRKVLPPQENIPRGSSLVGQLPAKPSQEVKVLQKGLVYSSETVYVAPTMIYGLFIRPNDFQMFFGRELGRWNDKKLSLMTQSVTVHSPQLLVLYRSVLSCITIYENSTGTDFHHLVPKKLLKEKNDLFMPLREKGEENDEL